MTSIAQETWKKTWGSWKLVIQSFILACFISGVSLFLGYQVIARDPIQMDQVGIRLLERSFLVIVSMHFALTGLAMVFLLWWKTPPGNNRIFIPLIFPFLIYLGRYRWAAYLDYLLFFGTWLTLSLTLFVRRERRARSETPKVQS